MADSTDSRPSTPHPTTASDDELDRWHHGRPYHDQTPPSRWPISESALSETQSWSPEDYLDCAQRTNRDSPSPTMPRRILEAHGPRVRLSSLPRIPALLTSPTIQPNTRFTNPIPRSRVKDTACTVTLTIESYPLESVQVSLKRRSEDEVFSHTLKKRKLPPQGGVGSRQIKECADAVVVLLDELQESVSQLVKNTYNSIERVRDEYA